MKFTIKKNVLIEALNNVIKALSQKITIPVLNGIKFELTKKGLELTASDSELTIKVTIPEKDIINIEKEGLAIIQSKYILDIVRKMPSDDVCFEELENNNIKIFTNTNEFILSCYDKKDYPNFKIENSKDNITINSGLLKEIINKTSYAMSTQELRPLLTGLNFKITGNLLEAIATDSYRLSKKIVEIDSKLDSIDIVIPGRSVLELEKIITDPDELINMHFFTNKLLVNYKNIEFQTNLLNGTYPKTSHFIPSSFNYMININLNLFYDAIDRASLLATNKDKNLVKLILHNNEMKISSVSNEIGMTEEKIEIDSNNKEKLEISFNSKYMLDALKVIREENFLLLLNSDDSPIIVKPVQEESLTELILPIKNF